MSTSTLVKLSQISKNEVAQIGNIKVLEVEYELEKALLDNPETLRLEQDNYYLIDDGVFVSLNDASKKSGLSQKLLLALCQKDVLYGKKSGKNWFINNASLDNLIQVIWSIRKLK